MQRSRDNVIRIAGVIFLAVISCYYLWVFSLNLKIHVSEAFKEYYLKQETHFYSRWQDLYVVPGRVWNTYIDRPFFLSREGFGKPLDDGRGMEFSGEGKLIFKLHAVPSHFGFVMRFKTKSSCKLSLFVPGGRVTEVSLAKPGSYDVFLPIDTGALSSNSDVLNRVTLKSTSPLMISKLSFR